MTNFDYLKKEKQFDSFSEVAISSEKLLPIDREACVINCRVRWSLPSNGCILLTHLCKNLIRIIYIV